jgi:hypothetical protein
MRIAILGGTDYLDTVFEDWLYKLNSKHPKAMILTGTATGKNLYDDDKKKIGYLNSAEQMAASLMPGLGHEVWTPDMTTKTAQFLGANSDLQLGWILSGQWELYRMEGGALNHRFITPRPDVIVAVGNPDSSRAAAAIKHWQLFDAWREKEFQRPLVKVAAPEKKKAAKKRKPKKKIEQTEQIAA